MVKPVVAKGIAFISGAGGTGRTTAALNLARHLTKRGSHTLIFDLCFGWGGLGISENDLPTYEVLLEKEEFEDIVAHTNHGFDILTCVPPSFLDPSLEDLKKIAWIITHLGYEYDAIIFDPPSGAHPLSLLAAGMSDKVYLFSRPEAGSVASSYSLLKSLHAEGLQEKVRIAFSFVESAEQAASLKTRFDLLTKEFLGFKTPDGGFIYRQAEKADEEFFSSELNDQSEMPFNSLNLEGWGLFQNETGLRSQIAQLPDSQYQGR
jgi:MinD-like ATPase involved in chromosome partitioning or flagellar assembly